MGVPVKPSRKRKTTGLLKVSAEPAERRGAYRYECDLDATCSAVTLLRNPPSWPALVRDISRTGVNLILNGLLEVGTFLSVSLPPECQRALPLRVCIVRVRRLGARVWEHGCVLNPQLTTEEIEALL
jgi:hypothetical protein